MLFYQVSGWPPSGRNPDIIRRLCRFLIALRDYSALLNSISIAGSDNPLVEVEYKGKQSNVILTTQGESTLKIFEE